MTTPSKAEQKRPTLRKDSLYQKFYFADEADAIYESLEKRVADLNAALSEPVPQGEQSQLPQLVRPETIRARTLAGTNFIAYEANEADAVFSNLETELLDTKRALEMAADGLASICQRSPEEQMAALMDCARNERKGQQNG